jgi:Zn-dependent peptidase ImmA (M78 family)
MTMGISELSGRVILMPDKRFDYTAGQIQRFIKMWNDGEADTRICEYFGISRLEVIFLFYIVPMKN